MAYKKHVKIMNRTSMVLGHQRCIFGVITTIYYWCGYPESLFVLLPLNVTLDSPSVQVLGGPLGLSRSTLARRGKFWFHGGWIILFYIPRSSQLCVSLLHSPRSSYPARARTNLTVIALFWRHLKLQSQRTAAFPKIYAETAQKFSVIGRYLKSLFKL